MVSTLTNQLSPIGLDIGSRRIKAAQLKISRSAVCLHAVASLPRVGVAAGEDGAIDLARLGMWLQRSGLEGRRIALAAPQEHLLMSLLELPPRESGAPVDELARQELARLHDCESQAMEAAAWDLPRSPRARAGLRMMAAGCRHTAADELLEPFESNGWVIHRLDIEACSLLRACMPMLQQPGALSAIVDLGWRETRIMLVHQHVVVYERRIPDTGIASGMAALAERLHVDLETAEAVSRWLAEDARRGAAKPSEPDAVRTLRHDEPQGQRSQSEDAGLRPTGTAVSTSDQQASDRGHAFRAVDGAWLDRVADELRASFEFACYQYPEADDGNVLLVGGGAELLGVREELAAGAGRSVDVGDPSRLFAGAASGVASSPAMMAAIGLARAAL